jgi:hypothetical protein
MGGTMDNHFGKGLIAGMKAPYADSAQKVVGFCADYKRGFVLGFRTVCLRKPATVS